MLIHLLVLFSLIFSSSTKLQPANSNPDFTGTWNARIVADPNAPIQQLKISYDDPKLEIIRSLVERTSREWKTTGSRNFVFYTDGRGEINVKNGLPTKSVTKRKGQNVSFSSSKSKGDGITINTYESKKWTISEDGQSLVEITETKVSLDQGYMSPPKPTKLIYARSSSPLPK